MVTTTMKRPKQKSKRAWSFWGDCDHEKTDTMFLKKCGRFVITFLHNIFTQSNLGRFHRHYAVARLARAETFVWYFVKNLSLYIFRRFSSPFSK